MSKPKAAAKAVAVKKAAPEKEPRLVPEHLLVPVDAGQWPTNLDDDTAEKLFDAVECGKTPSEAATDIGMKENTLWKWKERHPAFASRLTEALRIGANVMVDGYRAIKAVDRDSAAGANIEITKTDRYLLKRFPETFHINPFKAPAGGGDGAALLGVVLVPMKVTQQDERPAIEGSAVRVPSKVPA